MATITLSSDSQTLAIGWYGECIDCCSEHGTTITAGGAGSKNISLSAQAGASGCFKYNDTGQTTTAEEWLLSYPTRIRW